MTPLIENPFSWMYFPTALALGALHALEPGHAKTLTAAYLIGIKGTKKDAFFLGLSVAFTHSLVVIGISVAALWLGRETFTQDVTHWLQMGSGAVVVVLGSWMLIKRVRQMRRIQHHHGAPEPVRIKTENTQGILEIIMTTQGERIRYIAEALNGNLELRIIINRPEGLEVLSLHSLNDVVKDTKIRISEILVKEPDLVKGLQIFSDDRAVRIMTIHKSKGLEFDSVVLLGVEKETFWSDLDAERCAFFVGVSRAKRRLVLTRAEARATPSSRPRRWNVQRLAHEEFMGYATTFTDEVLIEIEA